MCVSKQKVWFAFLFSLLVMSVQRGYKRSQGAGACPLFTLQVLCGQGQCGACFTRREANTSRENLLLPLLSNTGTCHPSSWRKGSPSCETGCEEKANLTLAVGGGAEPSSSASLTPSGINNFSG